jgi:hypothetical protein
MCEKLYHYIEIAWSVVVVAIAIVVLTFTDYIEDVTSGDTYITFMRIAQLLISIFVFGAVYIMFKEHDKRHIPTNV